MYKTRSRNYQHAIEHPKETLTERLAKLTPRVNALVGSSGGQVLEVGGDIAGVVKKVLPFGVVLIVDEMEGFIHISEISHQWVRHPSEHFAIGDVIRAQVISIDMAKNRIGLSLKRKGSR